MFYNCVELVSNEDDMHGARGISGGAVVPSSECSVVVCWEI